MQLNIKSLIGFSLGAIDGEIGKVGWDLVYTLPLAPLFDDWIVQNIATVSNAANEKGDLHLRNTEQLTEVMPFLPEDELKKLDTIYSKKEDWASYLIKDGPFITGQNPASSKEAAKQLLALL